MVTERIEVKNPEILQQSIEIPRDRRGRIRWSVLKQNPERLLEFIESEVSQFYQDVGEISVNLLTQHKRSDLHHAIFRHYPGKMGSLRAKLEIGDFSVKPNGYWTAERIEQEVLEFSGRESAVTAKKLKETRRGDLLAAIHRNGHLHDLLTRIGIKPSANPKGYWTAKRILEEVRDISFQEGKLSHGYLIKTKRSALSTAIARRYPGGWRQLKEDLNINHSVQTISPEEANEDLDRLLEDNI